MAVWTISFNLLQLRPSIPNPSYGDCSIELNRIRGARQRIKHALNMGVPDSKVEVEIVLPISHLGTSLRCCVGLGC
jgi:hypothetical protein